MYFYVYRTINLLNQKFYIGVHKSRKPIDDYVGSGRALQKAIEKYGLQNFKTEVLSYHDSLIEAFEEEARLVTPELISSKTTYNMSPGGHGGSGVGHIKNFGKLKRARTAKEKSHLSAFFTGKTFITPEGRKKCSDASKGNKNALGMTYTHTQEAKDKISAAKKGIIFSKEHRQHLSAAKIGRCTGAANAMAKQEHRDKVAASKIGRKLLVNDSGVRRLSKPGSEQWIALLALGFKETS